MIDNITGGRFGVSTVYCVFFSVDSGCGFSVSFFSPLPESGLKVNDIGHVDGIEDFSLKYPDVYVRMKPPPYVGRVGRRYYNPSGFADFNLPVVVATDCVGVAGAPVTSIILNSAWRS